MRVKIEIEIEVQGVEYMSYSALYGYTDDLAACLRAMRNVTVIETGAESARNPAKAEPRRAIGSLGWRDDAMKEYR